MNAPPPAGMYVHLPFCPYICPYCDFAKWAANAPAQTRYLAALEAEIARTPPRAAATLFVGGGTPNTYASADVARLVRTIADRFGLARDAETSVEINPDLALCEGFSAYVDAGINRLSIGVQSFDEGELRALGRRHRAADVREVVRRARAAGFTNVSIDLMFGVPGQTPASWERSLAQALALEPEHVSTYGLTVEDGTPYATWQARDPAAFSSNDLEAELYALAIERLAGAGFEHYEVSNFALPGRRSRHNANYWANGEYLGFGVGAASYAGGERRVQTRDLRAYLSAVESGAPIPADAERLAPDAALGEAVMLALRTAEGVDADRFAERYAIDVRMRYRDVVKEMAEAGMIVADARGFRLTQRGRFVANDVLAEFLSDAR